MDLRLISRIIFNGKTKQTKCNSNNKSKIRNYNVNLGKSKGKLVSHLGTIFDNKEQEQGKKKNEMGDKGSRKKKSNQLHAILN